MAKENKQTFSIGDAAKMTGASQKCIRNWEANGYIPLAERVVCGERGYRRFTMDEVNTIRQIKDYLNEGFTLLASAQKATGMKFSNKGGHQNA